MRRGALAALLLLLAPPGRAATDVLAVAEALAAPEMEGRGAGTAGIVGARDLVRGHFERVGLRPGFGEEWLQSFEGPGGETQWNVAGWVPGAGEEWIVVGAHYDGLGVREVDGALALHPGADDNASGVAALVWVAEATVAAADELDRSVCIVAFSGEETGLGGSKALLMNPPAPLEGCVAMLNLDTVGRLENDQLLVFGAGTAGAWKDILTGVNHGFRFDLAITEGSGSASDHAPFLAAGIPALHFFTGAKAEYHRPGDGAELLNGEGLERIADFVGVTTVYLASSAIPLTFLPEGADARVSASDRGPRRRVSFGSIPDFAHDSGGILLSGVMPDGPAEAAGLEKGDLLVAIDDALLDTLEDFQAALAGHQPGDVVRVTYVRDGEKAQLDLTLAERK